MKKKMLLLLCFLCIGGLAGCEKTPENIIVREKGAQSIQNYKSVESSDSSLRESLHVPQHYTNRSVYENGRLVIDTDAAVFLPDTDAVSTYAVTAKEVNQELIDRVTETFFPEATFYRDAYLTKTKADIQQEITTLKKYKSDGNLDPFHYGTDENGGFYFDIDAKIAQYEEDLKEAPEVKNEEEIKPAFGLTYLYYEDDNSPEEEVGTDYFYGIAKVKDTLYRYEFHRMGPGIEFTITKVKDQQEVAYWVSGEELMDGLEETSQTWTEEDIKKFIPISFEDAKQIASEKASKLGMDLEVYGWDYELYYRGNYEIQESNIIDGGYMFYFSRVTDNVPVTYTSECGGVYEGDIGEEPTFESWKYERCNILVGSDGICVAEVQNPYEIGAAQTTNIKLLDFEDILRIYEQMMEISNADLAADEILRTYHIRRISFGYSRIYDPTVNNAAGLLVPVWDFFGEFDVAGADYQVQNSGEHSTRSFLTINAADGTIINRELGY